MFMRCQDNDAGRGICTPTPRHRQWLVGFPCREQLASNCTSWDQPMRAPVLLKIDKENASQGKASVSDTVSKARALYQCSTVVF